MRDVVGGFCLGAGCAAAVSLVLGLLWPRMFARGQQPEGTGAAPGPLILTLALGPIAAGFLLLGWALLIAPVYAVGVEPKGQIVAAPGTTMIARVSNAGLLGGAYEAPLTLDDEELASVAVDVPAGDTVRTEIAMPGDLSPGRHTLELGDFTYAFTALTPPEFAVGRLRIDPGVAKVGQTVEAAVMVRNRGEADGTFVGVLEIDRQVVATSDVRIEGGGGTALVSFEFERRRPGAYRLAVSGANGTAVVVRPMRPVTGTVLEDSLGGGPGTLVVDNRYREDCLVCLTRSKSSKRPLLGVYVRGRDRSTVGGVRDGRYWVFVSVGEDWNRLTDDFLTSRVRERFPKPMRFTTKRSTSVSTNDAARTVTTTRTTRSTVSTLVLGADEGMSGVPVSECGFPAPR